MKTTIALGFLALSASAQAITLFNNGPVVNSSGLSVVTLPATTLGFGAQTVSGNSVADDFSVAAGDTWTVSSINLYNYQTGSVAFTFQTATWSVVAGNVNTGAVVASGTTAVTNGGLVGYRVSSTTLTNTQRGIYNSVVDVPDFALGAGSYFLRWNLTGTLASGPWQVPTSDGALGNAYQSVTSGPFTTLVEEGGGRSVTLPFTLNGTVTSVPEPGGLALMLAGGLAVAAAARRRALR